MTRTTVTATPGPNNPIQNPRPITIVAEDREFAHGTFGTVYKAKLEGTLEEVAVKKVLQERHYRNRELAIIRQLVHPNIVELKYFYYEETTSRDLYLHLIMEYVPDCLYRVVRRLSHQRRYMPLLYVRLVMHQLLRALAYIHARHICHRDIKPHNLLLDPSTGVLKLCDFGSSKIINTGETNVAYICSRFYRSPECIFGQTQYDTSIDIWSTGCIFGELLTGVVLFVGMNRAEQIAQIIKILGSPSPPELNAMNPEYGELELPHVPKKEWTEVFDNHVPGEAITLIDSLLQYTPQLRPTAFEAMTKEFFLPLRDPGRRLPDGLPLPALYDWTEEESAAMPDSIRPALLGRPQATAVPNS